MLTTTRKRARRVAATAAACAAAALLIPAGSAQGATRLSKSAITRIKQNETVLKRDEIIVELRIPAQKIQIADGFGDRCRRHRLMQLLLAHGTAKPKCFRRSF